MNCAQNWLHEKSREFSKGCAEFWHEKCREKWREKRMKNAWILHGFFRHGNFLSWLGSFRGWPKVPKKPSAEKWNGPKSAPQTQPQSRTGIYNLPRAFLFEDEILEAPLPWGGEDTEYFPRNTIVRMESLTHTCIANAMFQGSNVASLEARIKQSILQELWFLAQKSKLHIESKQVDEEVGDSTKNGEFVYFVRFRVVRSEHDSRTSCK